MGKSTTAQMLGRDHGYVYYEADCFANMKNPYVPLDVESPREGIKRKENKKKNILKIHVLTGYQPGRNPCFFVLFLTPSSSMAQMHQKVLKGPGADARKEVLGKVQDIWSDLMTGKGCDKELMKLYYGTMAEDIGSEKKRIGGDFAIAHVILTKDIRDKMREWLGPDLIFVHLEMSQEDRRARVLGRHQGNTDAADLMDVNIRNIKNVTRNNIIC